MKIKRKHRIVKLLILSFALIVCALLVWFVINSHNTVKSPTTKANIQTIEPVKASPVSLSSKIMFVGDIFWGRRVNGWSQASNLKEAYPFSGLSTFDRTAYDAWVGNMECPTDPNVTATAYQEEELLQFNCPSTYLPEFAKWFDIVSLANNHTDNQGAEGFAATRTELDKNGIQYFGHYDPYQSTEVCEVVNMPVHFTLSDSTINTGSIPFALCGYHGVFKIPSEESLAVIQKYSEYMPVIAYPHMGKEYQTEADQLRTDLYRKMIDYGADAVIGNHPHWVQNSEAYKGKLIVYSMGNFIFDQQDTAEVTRSAVINLNLATTDQVSSVELTAWLKLGEQCSEFADSCLTLAKEQNLSKLPLTFTFGMMASDDSGKLAHLADKTVTQAVINRTDWNQTASELVPAGLSYPAN